MSERWGSALTIGSRRHSSRNTTPSCWAANSGWHPKNLLYSAEPSDRAWEIVTLKGVSGMPVSERHKRTSGEEELDLVPVGVAGHAGVVEPDLQVRALAAAKDDGFVPNRAEALDPLDRLDQRLRRGSHIVEQADRAQIELSSEFEPEPVSPHGPSRRLDKGDLSFGAQAFVGIVDLHRGQARRLQKRAKVETGGARFLSRETR